MKLHKIQKTSTKLFDLYVEVLEDKHLYIKLTTECNDDEFMLPLNEQAYWEWDDMWDEYIDFHCENCDDPTYWFSGEGNAKDLNGFTKKLWNACH